MEQVVTVTTGQEYGEALCEVLATAFAAEEAVLVEKYRGIIRLQDVGGWKCQGGDDIIEVVAETHLGLSITGSAQAAERLERSIRDQL